MVSAREARLQIDDAALMAFIMGDLEPARAARIDAALKDNPALAARLERIRGVRMALRKVYDSVAAEPVPERLRALLGDVAVSEAANKTRDQPAARTPWRSALALAALFAGLMIGVLVGRLAPDGALMGAQGGVLRARPVLSEVLSARLSDAPENGDAALRVGVTFSAQGNQICRTFFQPAHNVAGVACRTADAWDIRVVESAPSLAAAFSVNAFVDEAMVGAPFSVSEEMSARESGWRADDEAF